jgi:hypothetical protein
MNDGAIRYKLYGVRPTDSYIAINSRHAEAAMSYRVVTIRHCDFPAKFD